MNLTILTSKKSWINLNRKKIIELNLIKGIKSLKVITDPKQISNKNEILIILSYTNLINQKNLKKSNLNLVVHESNLPSGKGWTPLFWQILEGKSKVITTLFEPNSKIDDGKIIFKKVFNYPKDLVYEEIKVKQFKNAINLINKFISKYKKDKTIRYYKTKKNIKSSFYKKRTPDMSRISLEKSLKTQFDLLRISDNMLYPCYFYFRGKKYYLKLTKNI